MADFLDFSHGLHEASFDAKFRMTYLGQGHLAGTGPIGATCCLCRFWGLRDKENAIQPPGHYSKSNAKLPGCLKKAKCNVAIPHKANRRYPHSALACSLFEVSDSPPLEVKVFEEEVKGDE